ncbi:MAG: hypothetical protein ACXADW_08625 [Candidatus Hodarchaeales archaeon]|jgi:hypothetical protein
MRILVQWAQSQPEDWVEIDSSEWVSLPKKAEPKGNEIIDNTPGWVQQINVQGVTFFGDHIAVEDIASSGIRVYVWNDDQQDWGPHRKHAFIWEFYPLAPDPNFGQAYNTRQYKTYYLGKDIVDKLGDPKEQTVILPWSDFVEPSESITRHGIWLSDLLNDQHEDAISMRGYTEWTDGVPEQFIDASGHLIGQAEIGLYSKPKGTIRYIKSFSAVTISGHAGNDLYLFKFATGTQQDLTNTLVNGQVETFVWISESGTPGSAQWPVGIYRSQLNVITNQGTNEVAVLPLDGTTGSDASGHFSRRAGVGPFAGIGEHLEVIHQDQNIFTGTGLKLATASGISWDSGDIEDRFEVSWANRNPADHGGSKQTVVRINTADSFADGPWQSGVAPPPPEIIEAQIDPVFLFAL